jgi:hypothetical protein
MKVYGRRPDLELEVFCVQSAMFYVYGKVSVTM